MAKLKRKCVGSVYKAKPKEDGTPQGDYIKLRGDMKDDLLKAVAGMGEKGLSLRLESKKMQQDSAAAAHASGKLSADVYDKVKARLEKVPDYVRFEIILLSEE